MDVAFADGHGFVSSLLTASVRTFDLATGELDAVTIPVGIQPTGMAAVEGRVLVANTGFLNYDPDTFVSSFADGSLTVIDAASRSAERTVDVDCITPQWVEAKPATNRIYVLCSGDYGASTGRLLALEGDSYATAASVAFAGYPGTLGLGAHRLFVGGFGAGLAVLRTDPLQMDVPFSDGVLAGTDTAGFAEERDGTLWIAQWSQKRAVALDSSYSVAVSVDVGSPVQDVVALD